MKKSLRLSALAVLLVSSCMFPNPGPSLPTTLPSPPASKSLIPCGVNLAGLADWSEEVPFKDMFKIVRPWNNEDPTGLTLDENGWVTSLGANAMAEAAWDAPVTDPVGEFVCLYDGEGDVDVGSPYNFIEVTSRAPGRIEFTLHQPAERGFWTVQITRTDPVDYVRRIRVMKREYEATYQADPWNPDFIATIADRFSTLRFMDWQATNNSLTANWADRKPAGYYTQTGCATGRSTAVAIEYMVDLCNRTGSNGWFCLPHLATDDYILQFAAYLRDNMNSGLKIYIEYSNECWNWQFDQTEYCHVQGVAQGLDPDEWTAWRRFYAKRSIEMFHIFESVFSGQTDRLVRVLASQGAYYDMTGRVLNYVFPDGSNQTAARHADALAIAPYFGTGAHEAAGGWNLDQLFRYLDNEVNGLGTPGAGDTVRRWMIDNHQMFVNPGSALDQPNTALRLIAYEGGQHLLPLMPAGAGWQLDPVKLELFRQAQRDPRLYALYKQYLTHWREAGGEMFALFSDVGNWGEWGYWGLLEYLSQPGTSSPKYAAALEWINENPTWWQ